MQRIATAIIVASVLTACGAAENPEEFEHVSNAHFITFGPGVSGLVGRAKQPKFTVCLSGVAEADRKTWEDNIRSTILKWVRPLRAMTGDALVSQIDVRSDTQSGCDTDVRIAPGTWSNTSIGSRPTVRMSDKGYFASYNVLLHEFGHGFALSDTYQSRSGDCKPGQPQAVMCNTSFDDLQPDDIAGLTEIYKSTYPNDRPPPPGTQPTDPGQLPYKLYAAIGQESGAQDRMRLHFSLVGAPQGQDAGTMSYCLGAPEACKQAGAQWADAARAGSRPDVPVFATAGGVDLRDGLTITLRYKNDKGTTYQGMILRRQG